MVKKKSFRFEPGPHDLPLFDLFKLDESFDQKRNSSLQSGIWKVKLFRKEDLSEPFYENQFLIMPSKDNFRRVLTENEKFDVKQGFIVNGLESIWESNNLCFFIKHNLDSKFDCKSTKWSTFYPDPKSDLASILPK
jgi:hypothetical protein